MATHNIVQEISLTTEECCNCGVVFALPAEMMSRLRRTKEWFYCPNGHAQSYTGKSDAQLRREAEAQMLALQDQLAATTRDFKRQVKAAKAEATRLRKRAAGGACPCCNRTFVQLSRHIETQHPGYVAA